MIGVIGMKNATNAKNEKSGGAIIGLLSGEKNILARCRYAICARYSGQIEFSKQR